jgi:hypothetical protein
MCLVAFAWGLLLVSCAAFWWSARRLHSAGNEEACKACGYERFGLRATGACPECAGTTWVRGHERLRGARGVQRLAMALLPGTIGVVAMGSLALGIQPQSLPHSVVIAGAAYAVLTIVLCIRYRFHAARKLWLWSAALAIGCSAFQGIVVGAYWSGPPPYGDSGWPLTDVVLTSLVCFVFTLMACPLIWVFTALPGACLEADTSDVASGR